MHNCRLQTSLNNKNVVGYSSGGKRWETGETVANIKTRKLLQKILSKFKVNLQIFVDQAHRLRQEDHKISGS